MGQYPPVTFAIPSVPPRTALLSRMLASIAEQTVPADGVAIAFDHRREGAGPNRTRAMMQVRTPWLAFADDDDVLLPHHLETLLQAAEETGADIVWPWFRVSGGGDPIACNRGKQWDSAAPHTFPITTLVRTELAQQLVFNPPLSGVGCSGEDFAFWIHMDELGAKFHHVNEETWIWHHDNRDSPNLAGLPNWP